MQKIVKAYQCRETGHHRIFSILIPSWNNLPYLKLCIQSIRENSSLTHQLIVHVNDGSDGTLAWVQQQADIDYTHSSKNIGVCYGLNAGRSLVACDYIVYMNDDMYACPGWDTALYSEVQAVGHHHFFLSATAIEPATENPCAISADFGQDIESFDEQSLLEKFSSIPFSDWMGATWPPNIVHKCTWDLVGGYSIEFSPGMYSDPDFSMKLWKSGVRLFKGVSASRVYHFGSKSVGRITKNKGYYLFIKKWGITPGSFTGLFLKRGNAFNGPTTDPVLQRKTKAKNAFKRFGAGLRKNR